MDCNEERICWIDLETTGLNPNTCDVIEVACVVTDNNLSEIASYEQVVSFDPPNPEDTNPFVVEMHTKNGLWADCANSICSLVQCEQDLFNFIYEHAHGAPLAGSTISFDRAFMKAHLAKAEGLLHYRNIDVSTLRELARRFAGIDIPKKEAHRAPDDIRESIAVLKELNPRWGASRIRAAIESLAKIRVRVGMRGSVVAAEQIDDVIQALKKELK